VQVLKLRTAKVMRAKKDSYLANFSGDYSDEIDNNIEYFIVFPDKSTAKVKLNRKSIVGSMGKYADKADAYLKAAGKVNEETLAGMVKSINQG
jgi:hypothetical protein